MTVLWLCCDCAVTVLWLCCDSAVTVPRLCCGCDVAVLWLCCDVFYFVAILTGCCLVHRWLLLPMPQAPGVGRDKKRYFELKVELTLFSGILTLFLTAGFI